MRNVIYTAIFGGYDTLLEPKVIPGGFDFVCFADRKISSKHWQVRVVEQTEDDLTRNNRKYKILPHRYLGGYDTSIYIDGNILVRGDVNELVRDHLATNPMALFDHAYTRHLDRDNTPDFRDCIYHEANILIDMYEKKGRRKEHPDAIRKQVERYRAEGYPEHRGFGMTTVLLRRHHDPAVVSAMEAWWAEYKVESKRDQLSFNYIAWKTGLDIAYIPDNVRENGHFLMKPHSRR